MTRAFLVLALAIIIVSGVIGYKQWAAAPVDYAQTIIWRPAHRYNDAAVSVKRVAVRLVYAVGADKKAVPDGEWKFPVTKALWDIARFHNGQMQGVSHLAYSIYPSPVVLEHPESFYNTTSTENGNPRALISIAQEIDRRVLTEGGDLYSEDFAKVLSPGEYPILVVIYEGVGASGGIIYDSPESSAADIAGKLGIPVANVSITSIKNVLGVVLLNRRYLKDGDLSGFGETFLYHEVGHALGYPDYYDSTNKNGASWSEGIMGAGRYDPLEGNYIENDILEKMGVMGDAASTAAPVQQ